MALNDTQIVSFTLAASFGVQMVTLPAGADILCIAVVSGAITGFAQVTINNPNESRRILVLATAAPFTLDDTLGVWLETVVVSGTAYHVFRDGKAA
jgi:hypothetical protein